MISASPRSGTHFPSTLEGALAWLRTSPPEDPLLDLAPLHGHLRSIADIELAPRQYLKIVELFQTRAGLAGSTIKPLLLDATLPVAKRLRTLAQGLMAVHGALALAYLKLVGSADLKRPLPQLCAAGLAHLSQQFEVAQAISAPLPVEFWEQAQRFYRQAIASPMPTASVREAMETASLRMKCLLALAAAQPEGLSPREATFLAAYLRNCASAVDIGSGGPVGSHAFWLDTARDFLPTSASRRPLRDDAITLHYSCAALGQLAARHITELAAGAPPETLDLPREAALADYRQVLSDAQECWTRPPKRQASRHRQGRRIQVCTHLGPLWRQMRSASAAAAETSELAASDWMILNESPSGYAIMHVAGGFFGLLAGSAVGLRTAPEQPWHICIVRWTRSDNPEHIELGLELLAPHATAVHIARHGTGEGATPLPALLLPPLPALDRGEALLTARGAFAPGTFTLINESNASLRIADCTANRLAFHTAHIEVFEFQRQLTPT